MALDTIHQGVIKTLSYKFVVDKSDIGTTTRSLNGKVQAIYISSNIRESIEAS